MPLNDMMGECRLGYDSLHVIPSPPEDLPQEYVSVEYTCPCGEFTTRFALHRLLLFHLMGRPGRIESDPHVRPYLQMLSALQAEAILAARRLEKKDEEEEGDEDDDVETADR